jgi:integrase
MEVKFYLKDKHATSKTVIFCWISFEGYRVKFYTPESIYPKFWDSTNHRVKKSAKFPEYPEFNLRLDNIALAIKNILRTYINEHDSQYPTPQVLSNLLKDTLRNGNKADSMSFMSFFKQLIERSENGTRLSIKGQPISKGTIKTYRSTKNALEAYEKANRTKIDFDSIDLTFYNKLTGYFTTKLQYSANYIGKHIKTIKTVLNEATEEGHNKNDAYKRKAFITVRENVENIYLTEPELLSIMNIDLTHNKTHEIVRDLFIAGCYTGLRFSDLSNLTISNIEGDLIHIKQIKTGDKVTIPILPELRTILNKYQGQLPKAISNQKSNQYIKEICKLSPLLNEAVGLSHTKGGKKLTDTKAKYLHVSTHTARRSFATNAFKRGLPTLSIMAITGHKTEQSFMKYIKVSNEEHAISLAEKWNK